LEEVLVSELEEVSFPFSLDDDLGVEASLFL
jgi:hypothetical protein